MLKCHTHNNETQAVSFVLMPLWHPAFPLHYTPLLASLVLFDIVIIALFAIHNQSATIAHHMRYCGSATLSSDMFLQLLQLTVHHS